MRIFRGLWGRIGLVMFVTGLVLSPGLWDSIKLVRLASEGAIADYRLSHLSPEQYIAEIETALAAHDGDMARSLIALAQSQNVAVPERLVAELNALPPVVPIGTAPTAGMAITTGDDTITGDGATYTPGDGAT